MNPGAAINDLLPFQGSPFSLLGISPKLKLQSAKTEKVGFEPTVPCGITGFQDRLHKPLGHLSIAVKIGQLHKYITITFRCQLSKSFVSKFLQGFCRKSPATYNPMFLHESILQILFCGYFYIFIVSFYKSAFKTSEQLHNL